MHGARLYAVHSQVYLVSVLRQVAGHTHHARQRWLLIYKCWYPSLNLHLGALDKMMTYGIRVVKTTGVSIKIIPESPTQYS